MASFQNRANKYRRPNQIRLSMIIKGNSNLEVIKLSGSDFRICAILIPNSGNKKVTFKVLIHANREYALGIVMRSFFAASMHVIS